MPPTSKSYNKMKQLILDIYYKITVHIPHTLAWKHRKRMQAIEKYQGTITFTRKFFIDDDLPLPPEFAGA